MADPDPVLIASAAAWGDPSRLVLDLQRIASEVELSPVIANACALAASVVLDQLHDPRSEDPAFVSGEGRELEAVIRRVDVDDRARATCADPQESTEEGAEAVAFLTARRVLDRIVFKRLPKRTGADYLMRGPSGGTEGDEEFESLRLECSGIGEGREGAAERLRKKIQQLSRYPDELPGYAVVTDFKPEPVEILFERWPK
jgi:hypothetical protein